MVLAYPSGKHAAIAREKRVNLGLIEALSDFVSLISGKYYQ